MRLSELVIPPELATRALAAGISRERLTRIAERVALAAAKAAMAEVEELILILLVDIGQEVKNLQMQEVMYIVKWQA